MPIWACCTFLEVMVTANPSDPCRKYTLSSLLHTIQPHQPIRELLHHVQKSEVTWLPVAPLIGTFLIKYINRSAKPRYVPRCNTQQLALSVLALWQE